MRKIEYPLTAIEYGSVVELIASGYFDAEGEYDAFTGVLNSMYVFYKFCYKKDDEDVSNADDMAEIAENDLDFIEAFNNAISGNGYVCFNFANAYYDAMELVRYRQDTAVLLINKMKATLDKVAKKMLDLTAERFGELTDKVLDSGISVEDISKIIESISDESTTE